MSKALSLITLQQQALKLRHLQHLAFLTGLPSTGTKGALESGLCDGLSRARLPDRGGRILSIDMGIRNLAYCVVNVPEPRDVESRARAGGSALSSLKVQEWRRVDVLKPTDLPDSETPGAHAGKGTRERPVKGRSPRRKRSPTALALSKDAFTPSVLSKTAYSIAKDMLVHKPTTILIERQRFRSGGASAIQEWTVRVNMFESMLWACFETLSHAPHGPSQTVPIVHEVNPARVAKFWVSGAGGMQDSVNPLNDIASAGVGKAGKITKEDKIAVLRPWLTGDGDLTLEFSEKTRKIVDAIREVRTRRSRSAITAESEAVGKLDDLADCLLQAAAWVRWEDNRRKVAALLFREPKDEVTWEAN